MIPSESFPSLTFIQNAINFPLSEPTPTPLEIKGFREILTPQASAPILITTCTWDNKVVIYPFISFFVLGFCPSKKWVYGRVYAINIVWSLQTSLIQYPGMFGNSLSTGLRGSQILYRIFRILYHPDWGLRIFLFFLLEWLVCCCFQLVYVLVGFCSVGWINPVNFLMGACFLVFIFVGVVEILVRKLF